MSQSVSSRFADLGRAEEALARIARQADLLGSIIVDSAYDPALEAFDLPDEALDACARQLADGGYLLVMLVADQEDANLVLDLLDSFAAEQPGTVEALPEAEASEEVFADVEAPADEPAADSGAALLIGERKIVRGGAQVRLPSAQVPDPGDVDEAGSETRRISAKEVANGGLLKARVIEFGETRERPVVAKHAFVREELVVRKTAEERVEAYDDTVRRTEVKVEELPDPRSALRGFAEEGGGAGRPA